MGCECLGSFEKLVAYALTPVTKAITKQKIMNNTIKENNGGSGFRITKPPLRTTLPGCPVAELRFHGNVENKKVKKVSDQQRNKKRNFI